MFTLPPAADSFAQPTSPRLTKCAAVVSDSWFFLWEEKMITGAGVGSANAELAKVDAAKFRFGKTTSPFLETLPISGRRLIP